jgi:uncharacterized protein involved in exopolysaccharide biosynthesis
MRVQQENQISRHSGSSFTEYTRVLWRKKYFVLVPLVLCAVISSVGVRFLKPIYMASSVILMEDKSYLNKEIAPIVTIEEQRAALDEETLARLTGEIQSSDFLDRIIERLGLAQNPNLIAAANADRRTTLSHLSVDDIVMRRLRGMLVNKIQATSVGPAMFRLSCYDYSPRTAFVLADAVANLVIDAYQERRLEGLQQASEFSEEQLQVYKRRLEESEERYEQLQNQKTQLALESNPVGEAMREYAEELGGEANLRYAEALNEQLDIRIIELEGITGKIRERLLTHLSFVPNDSRLRDDPEVRNLVSSLNALREGQLRLELGARGLPSGDLERARAAATDTEKRLQWRLATLSDVVYADVEADYRPLIVEYHLQNAIRASYVAERDRLAAFIESFKQKIDAAPQIDLQIAKLEEEVRTNRELYQSFLMAKTSAQVSEAAQSTNLGMTIEILDKAVLPITPVKPNKIAIVFLAVVFGATLGVGGIVISEYTDTSFRTVEEIEKTLGFKVLAAVPSVGNNSGWNRARNRRNTIIWVCTVLIVVASSLVGFYFYGKAAAKQAIKIEATEPAGE